MTSGSGELIDPSAPWTRPPGVELRGWTNGYSTTAYVALVARGALSDDGSHASGTASVSVVWRRDGVAHDRCEAELTRWEVRRG